MSKEVNWPQSHILVGNLFEQLKRETDKPWHSQDAVGEIAKRTGLTRERVDEILAEIYPSWIQGAGVEPLHPPGFWGPWGPKRASSFGFD